MARRKTNEEFLSEVKSLVGNEYTFIDDYIKANMKIRVLHNKCGNVYKVTPNKFKQGRRCPECQKKHVGLQVSKSLTKTPREFEDEIRAMVGEEYTFIDEYSGSTKKMSVRHNVCGEVYVVTPTNFQQGRRCPRCSYKKSNDQFIKEVYRIVEDEYVFLEEYSGAHDKVKCLHNVCGYIWDISPSNFINGGHRCPLCAGHATKTNEEFLSDVYELVGDEYTFLEEYKGTRVKIKVKHNSERCGNRVFEVRPSHFTSSRSRCPYCNESKGERKISSYLVNNNLYFKQQYIFTDCRNILPLPFDFALLDSSGNPRMMIEYDGIQHFEPVEYFGGEENLKKVRKRDDIKEAYCTDNDIELLRIPYWDYDNIEEILNERINT